MKRKSDIVFVGDLQMYAAPYASLYYSGSENQYFISVRLSDVDAQKKQYAISVVSMNQISDYLNEKIGLRSMMSKVCLSSTPVPDIKNVANSEKKDVGKNMKTEEIFDPDFCTDMSNILWFLWKHNRFDLDNFSK